jgi:peptidoglycan/LPS O-acetylase OafA/YrhL
MINQLTFTRFIAAISIVVFHYGMLSDPFTFYPLQAIFKHANLGVSYFFILSGFVMVIANGRRKGNIAIVDFYMKRVARIYPVYILALLLTTVIIFYVIEKREYLGVFLNTFAIQSWIPRYAYSLNGPGWSISIEFFFYFLFPLLFNFIYRKYRLRTVSICILIFWAISQLLSNYLLLGSIYSGHPGRIQNIVDYFPLIHLNEFLIGNIAGFVFLKYKDVRVKGIYVLVIFLLILTVLYFDLPLHANNGLMAVLFVPFILALSLNKGLIKRHLSRKIYMILGDISYSLYILQFPLYLMVRELFKGLHIINPSLQFLSVCIVLIPCAFASYYFIEVPGKKLIKSLNLRKAPQSPLAA